MITANEARIKTNKYTESVEGCLDVISNCIEQAASKGRNSITAGVFCFSKNEKDEIESNLIEKGFIVGGSRMEFIITW